MYSKDWGLVYNIQCRQVWACLTKLGLTVRETPWPHLHCQPGLPSSGQCKVNGSKLLPQMPCSAPFKLCAGSTGFQMVSHSPLAIWVHDLSCFSLPPPPGDNWVSLFAVKALSNTRFGINVCKAGFIQHSPDSPAEHALLEQDGKTKKEAARKTCSLQHVLHSCLCALTVWPETCAQAAS